MVDIVLVTILSLRLEGEPCKGRHASGEWVGRILALLLYICKAGCYGSLLHAAQTAGAKKEVHLARGLQTNLDHALWSYTDSKKHCTESTKQEATG